MATEKENKTSGATVAVVRFSALGDVAMAVAPLYACCRANPDCRFVFVTARGRGKMLEGTLPPNLSVFEADLRGVHSGVRGMWRLAADLNREFGRIDRVVDIHNVLRSKVLSQFLRITGAKVVTLDKRRGERARLIKNGANNAPALVPVAKRYADTLRRARLVMPETETAFKGLFHGSRTHHEASAFRVGIAPFAAHPAKVYPAEKLLEAMRKLAADGCQLLIFGAPGKESEKIDAMISQLPEGSARNIAAEGLGFAGELRLMADLDAMVSMDSANMHLAALAGTPTVSIWGPTHPAAGFVPGTYGPRAENICLGDKSLDCRPCSVFGNKPCRLGDRRCMEAIGPDDIVAAVKKLIKPEK